ncbi:MAG: isoprenylcysteine carboxylmethyltransferase family protein [Caldilinea sp. CFX5]|nr:isoprenylcysteine carboxylmethyltransferase family protein [Caldilinea sp. CFX5]
MSDFWLKAAFLVAIVAQIVIRSPYNRLRQQNRVTTDRVTTQEMVLLWLLLLGLLLSLIYIFTDWLAFADYHLPPWLGNVGILLLLLALWLFWRSHVDLGRNWSPSLQIIEQHTLVTNGVYRHIRHPMYAAQWLFVLAQLFLLQNWLAGPANLLCFIPFYFLRVPQEEQMMIEQFGAAYREYMARTGRLLPQLRR